MTGRFVEDIADRSDLQFVSDSQDVEAIKDHLGLEYSDYDSFFVKIEEGEYTEVYGMSGIVPWNWKRLFKINLEKG